MLVNSITCYPRTSSTPAFSGAVKRLRGNDVPLTSVDYGMRTYTDDTEIKEAHKDMKGDIIAPDLNRKAITSFNKAFKQTNTALENLEDETTISAVQAQKMIASTAQAFAKAYTYQSAAYLMAQKDR